MHSQNCCFHRCSQKQSWPVPVAIEEHVLSVIGAMFYLEDTHKLTLESLLGLGSRLFWDLHSIIHVPVFKRPHSFISCIIQRFSGTCGKWA